MSRNYNKVILVGHVGSAPESRSDTVATFSLATNASWKNKTSGEYDTRTDWHRITAFGKSAALVIKHVAKGKAVLIEGELRTDKYTTDGGEDRYQTYVAMQRFEVLDADAKKAPEALSEEEDFAF